MGIDVHVQTNGKAASELAGECVVMLSPREKLLLRRFANGKSDNLISQEIGGTQEQIGMQRKRLIEKLQIQSHPQLVAFAGQLAAWPARPGSG
jgi:DNA-binding CsgD family transcriptional regulator